YDEAAGNLVIVLQGAPQLRIVSLAGVLLNTVMVSPTGPNVFDYLTSVAADANFYYFADYTCNNGCPDLFRVGKGGGVPTQISNEILAYGGYPLAIGGGKMFRGEIINNEYNYTNLNQIRVSDLATPDTVTQTHTIPIARGIGDLTWDGSTLWALGYSHDSSPNRNVDLLKIDPATGAVLETHLNVYNPGAPYNPSGLAYAQGHLYVLNYSETSGVGSTLTKLACQ
ncbi:MAG: hypothetical protein L6Q76_26715, partial [Polyangiaceae bacterium]|nr:hypothetical protein [Polyangiaceae bacterium]